MTAILKLETERLESFDPFQNSFPDNLVPLNVKHFGGDTEIAIALITLTSINVAALARVLVEEIRAKRYVSPKVKDVEIVGCNVDERVIEQALRSQLKRTEDEH